MYLPSCSCLVYFAHSSEISARATVLWWGLIFAETVLSGNSGVQFVHGAESGVRSVIEPFGILFRRHESRGAAAFPRNYCLLVNSQIFRQPMQGVSELELYREAISRRSGMKLWFYSGKQRCLEWVLWETYVGHDVSFWYLWVENF